MATAPIIFLPAIVASLFLGSGLLKLRDRSAFASAVDGFAVLPGPVRSLAAVAVPVGEVAIGALVLLSSGRLLVAAAWLAAAALAAFTVLVGVTLARGERPSCHCFGAVSPEPLSSWTLARNVALLALGVLVAAGLRPDRGVIGGLVEASASTVADLVVLVGLALAVLVLWVRLDGLVAAGGPSTSGATASDVTSAQPAALAASPIPPLRLMSPDLLPRQLVDMAAEKAQLLLFVSPTCSTCHALVPLAVQWQDVIGEEIDVRLVSIGGRDETVTAYPDDGATMWLDDTRAYEQLGVPGTPTALLLGTNGSIGAGPAAGVEAIQELLATIVQALSVNMMTGTTQHSAGHAHPDGETTREDQTGWVPDIGSDVAPLTVVTETGAVASYAEALAEIADGGLVTAVAWRHDCGYCEQIVEEVRDASARGDVVLVIDEDPSTVRAQGMTGPVLQVMPPGNAVGAVGVPGTPAAVPVQDGVVAGLGGIGGPHTLEVIAEFAGEGARSQR